jgi:hypothetical protein
MTPMSISQSRSGIPWAGIEFVVRTAHDRLYLRLRLGSARYEADTRGLPPDIDNMSRSVIVTRWAKAGKLTSICTLGGYRRYLEAEVRGLLNPSAQTGPGQPTGRRADGDDYTGTGHRAVAHG